MRTAKLALTIAIILVATTPAFAEIQWESSIRDAHSKASQEGKLLLIHFERDNCVYCDKLEAGAFQTQLVGNAIEENFVPLKVNASKDKRSRDLAKMFKVNRFPMDVVVTLDGQPLAHGVSPQDPNRYVAMLAKTLPSGVTGTPSRQIAAVPPQRPVAPHSAPSVAQTEPLPSPPELVLPPETASQEFAAAPATVGNWELPNQTPQAQTTLAGAKTNVMSEPGGSGTKTMPAKSHSVGMAGSKTPELAMDGFCSVTVVNDAEWVEGKTDFGVIHLGKLYLFANEQAMQTFLADPLPYTPVLNEIDVIRFFEERKIVMGKREFAMQDPLNKRMFFFADEAAMNHFAEEYERYVDAAIMVMDKAIQESNPGT